jgi:hypothetical protein
MGSLQQASDVWDPNKPSEVSPSRIRSHLPRLQGVRQGFPAAERISSSSTGLPPPKIASQLHRFLGMLNFYRRFLPNAAATQAPLHDILSRPRIKGSHPITWTPNLDRAFKECKVSLSSSTLLAHPNPKRKEIIGGCNPNVSIGCDTQ